MSALRYSDGGVSYRSGATYSTLKTESSMLFQRTARTTLSSLRRENKVYYTEEAERQRALRYREAEELRQSRIAYEVYIQSAREQYEKELAECQECKIFQQKLNKQQFYQQLSARNQLAARYKQAMIYNSYTKADAETSLKRREAAPATASQSLTSSICSSTNPLLYSKHYDELRPREFVRREIDFNKMITTGSLVLNGEQYMAIRMQDRVKRLDAFEEKLNIAEAQFYAKTNALDEYTLLTSMQTDRTDQILNYLVTRQQILHESLDSVFELIKLETLQLNSHLCSKQLLCDIAKCSRENANFQQAYTEEKRMREALFSFAEATIARLVFYYAGTADGTAKTNYQKPRIGATALKSRAAGRQKTQSRAGYCNEGNSEHASRKHEVKRELRSDKYALLRLDNFMRLARYRTLYGEIERLGVEFDFPYKLQSMYDTAKQQYGVDLAQDMRNRGCKYEMAKLLCESDSETAGSLTSRSTTSNFGLESRGQKERLETYLQQRIASQQDMTTLGISAGSYAFDFEGVYLLLNTPSSFISAAAGEEALAVVSRAVGYAIQALCASISKPQLFFPDVARCAETLEYMKNQQVNGQHNREPTALAVASMNFGADRVVDQYLIYQMREQISRLRAEIYQQQIQIHELQGFYKRIDRSQFRDDSEFQKHIKLLKTCYAYFNIGGVDYTLVKSEDLDSYTGPLSKYRFLKEITIDRQDESYFYIELALQYASIRVGIMNAAEKEGMIIVSQLYKLDKLFDSVIWDLGQFEAGVVKAAKRSLLRIRRKQLEDMKCDLLNQSIEVEVGEDVWYETLQYTKSAMERNIGQPKRVTALDRMLTQYQRDLRTKEQEETFYY